MLLLVLADAFLLEPVWLQVTQRRVPVAGLPAAFDGFTIVHLTDLHYPVGLSDAYYRRVVRAANAQHPDLIVMTGDYMPRGPRALPQFMAIVRQLHARYGVVAILGNHDSLFRKELRTSFRKAGITLLINQAVPITRNGQRIWIAGLDDLWYGTPEMSTTLRPVPPGETTILLAHEPDFADALSHFPVALQLSGHSHGGQICLPLFGPIYTPRDSRKYPAGLYRVNDMYLYTSRGIGGASLRGVQMRFCCRPEMPVLTLAGAR